MFEKLVNIYVMLTMGAFRYLPSTETPLAYSINVMPKSGVLINEIPHHVMVVYGDLYCSGSLISSRIVLTAASCLSFMKNDIKCYVKVGSNSITGMGQIIPVLEVKIHEYFQEKYGMDNDIAMLFLRDHVKFGPDVKKAVMIESDIALKPGTAIAVSGWSNSNTVQKFSYIVLINMIVMQHTDCKKFYGHFITNSNYCAKQSIERRFTDNGGSAMFNDLLAGVLSFEGEKRHGKLVAVFTNVSYFRRWININTARFLNKYCVESPEYSTSESSMSKEGE